MFDSKTLLITGGTGSFGNAVLRRFLKTNIGQIRIFSRDEKKQDDMRHLYRDPKVKFYIGDVRQLDSIQEAMVGVDFVFHAAALKQVPSCEFYPMEAVRTNVIGTDNTLQAAMNANVKRVIVLSTDKAAYPINAMGISKGMMEKVMIARSRVAAEMGLVFCGTRYGNVMGSRGSVIPLFIQQIEAGQQLTVTDPDMTRFMMNLDSAVDLVLFAFTNGTPGDRFVQKAPAVTIGVLAEAVKRLLKANNPVKIIGTRHGEKSYETLLTREEAARAEDLGDYYRVPADNRDLNYNLYFSEGTPAMGRVEDYHSNNARRLSLAEMMDLLLTLPEMREAMERRGVMRNTNRAHARHSKHEDGEQWLDSAAKRATRIPVVIK
ncbi:MAG TPA: polysaccharide biosynthesis protein [Candidatus Paceibacterota bacterium]|nr:polysaccharide biosynthesis protein [Candidatus Paceibacterota bacterium]